MNALILDDIKISRDGLITILSKIDPSINVTACYGTLEEARAAIKNQFFDLAFLDIQLKDGTSFELIDEIPFETRIIFITAYDEHAIEAIRKGAFDYLLKPINTADLRNCIQRIHDVDLQNKQYQETVIVQNVTEANSNILGISSLDSIDFLPIDEIIYLQADGKYTTIKTTKESIISSKNLGIFEAMLPDKKFMRVHHSYLLNLDYIKKYQKDVSLMMLKDGTQIPVSKARKEMLLQRLKHI